MSKHQNIATSIEVKLVRKFYFFLVLMLGMLTFGSASFAAECAVDGNGDLVPDTAKNCEYTDGEGITTYFDANGVASANPPAANGAADTSIAGVAKVICEVVFVLIFDIGRGIATLSIIALGIAAMFGKATWTQAVTVAAGIGIMYGGMTLVTILTLNLTNISGTNYACLAVLVGDVANALGNLR